VLNLKINFKNIYIIYFQIKKHFKKIKTNRVKPDQLANHLDKGPRTCRYAQRRLQKINELLIPLHSQKTTQFQQLPFSLQSNIGSIILIPFFVLLGWEEEKKTRSNLHLSQSR
jgi:hypothetical protein